MGNSNSLGSFSSYNRYPNPHRDMITYDNTNWLQLKDEIIRDSDCVNGYLFCEKYFIPESVLEIILSYVNVKDVLACNLVCRAWKDVLVRRSFWKRFFYNRNQPWSYIPECLLSHPCGWVGFFAHAKNCIFQKNFIQNHSGCKNFTGWTRSMDRGDGWIIEKVPVGAPPIPRDPFFHDSQHCFVGSYDWCSKSYQVDLWKLGLTPVLMQLLLPFQIECSQMYCTRFDCGSEFNWAVKIHDSDFHLIQQHHRVLTLSAGMEEWQKVSHIFLMKPEHIDHMKEVRFIEFIHDVKDSNFWAGWYSAKMARACVRIKMEPTAVETKNRINALQPLDESNDENSPLSVEEVVFEREAHRKAGPRRTQRRL